jgi:hypothetical protein
MAMRAAAAAAWLVAGAAAVPWACEGEPAVVDGAKYKTKVSLVQDGVGEGVTADNTRVRLSVKANLVANGGTGPTFPFEFANPYQMTKDPKKDGGMIVGFDVGLWPTPQPGRCGSPMCGFKKDSTRMMCIPPEEGYGSTPLPGIPANSTLIIEVKLLEVLPPPPLIKCSPHASPAEHCPGGVSCPPSGVCPLPPAPAPPPGPPPPPPGPPAPPTGKCLGGLVGDDCQAWTDLYDATGGPKWTACSNKRLDPCSCHGGVQKSTGLHTASVTCTTTTLDTRITSLDLGPNKLVGTVPESIGNLTELTEFGIFVNPGVVSTIPATVGQLTKLQALHLHENSFKGQIPPSIGTLTGLRRLMLNNNQLNGSIPSSFVKLSKLFSISLEHNRLSGLVPDFMTSSLSDDCQLDDGSSSGSGNKFACPLPASASNCHGGVHCSKSTASGFAMAHAVKRK